jgi:hypothetical protein
MFFKERAMKTIIPLSLLTLGVLLFTGLCNAVQVDGHCFLQNQINHQGSRVLFEADTPGAETDSAFTDSTGYYQIDLAAGGYDIYYSHGGFLDDSLTNRILVSPTTLPDITLTEFPHGVYISGALSGLLEDTTYIVDELAWVAQDDSLIVEAGATLYFIDNSSSYISFNIYGFLSAIGTQNDSIRFLSYPGFPNWGHFSFWDCPDTSRLEYCLFSGFHYSGPQCVRSSPKFTNCTITNNGSAVSCSESQPLFNYCKIYGNYGFQIGLNGEGNAIFDHCFIGGSTYEAVWCLSSSPIFRNCTIAGNAEQGIRNTDSSAAIILNCIIANNGIGISFDESPDVTVSYCDLYGNSLGNFTGNPPPYLGQIATVNHNGDPCDLFYNIFLNPQLVNPSGGNYHLQSGSPCIDAGDPTSPLDPDSTIADIGAFYFNQLGVINPPIPIQPTNYGLLPPYPNPFNSVLVIPFTLPVQKEVMITIYNILGQKVQEHTFPPLSPGVHRVIWNSGSCASGLYIIRLMTENKEFKQKVILLK